MGVYIRRIDGNNPEKLYYSPVYALSVEYYRLGLLNQNSTHAN